VVSSTTKRCKNHSSAGSWNKEHQYSYTKSCRVCGGTGEVEKPRPVVSPKRTDKGVSVDLETDGIVKAFDSLHKTLKFDRSLLKAFNRMKKGNDPLQLISAVVNHIEKFRPKEAIQTFKEAWLPEEAMDKITDETDFDKSVEKTQISKIIMWPLSLFLQSKTEDLAIKYIADTSATIIGREFGEGPSISDKTLGKRLENSKLIKAFEMMLQLCSTQLASNVFEEGEFYTCIYYDWFYLVKTGKIWEICQKMGRNSDAPGIKIGIGIEWDTKSVVSLVMHGEHHSNDALSFQRDLMLTDRPGIIHIADRGPFSTGTMSEIRENKQHFVIRLKRNIGYQLIHQISKERYKFELNNPSRSTIRVMEEKIITLNPRPELGELRYIKFQYNCLRTGQFKTIELITSLILPVIDVIELHARRWVSTEIEFRIYQHQFGLEKIYLKKPEKAWALLLLVLIGKMLMELTYRSIHLLHEKNQQRFPSMDTADFRSGFLKFISAVLTGIEEPWSLISPCRSAFCPYKKRLHQRRR